MLDTLQAELDMNRSVKALYADNKKAFDDLPDFAPEATQFLAGIDKIEALVLQIAGTTNVDTVKKAEFRKNMQEGGEKVHIVLKAYFTGKGNTDMTKKLNFPKSAIDHGTDQQALDYSQIILAAANGVKTDILKPAYGLVQQDLDDLSANITGFKNYLPRPKLSKKEQSSLNKQFKPLFQAQRDILKKMDIYADLLKVQGNQVLLDKYNKARSIQDSVRHHSLFGGVTNSDGPVFKAVLTIEELKKNTKTGKLGNYHFANLPDGEYTLTITALGHKPQTLKVIVQRGAPVRLDVALEKA